MQMYRAQGSPKKSSKERVQEMLYHIAKTKESEPYYKKGVVDLKGLINIHNMI